MSDTTTPTAVPAWLAGAEQIRKNALAEEKGHQILRSKRHAKFVNVQLRELGVEAQAWATVGPQGDLIPALLCGEDWESETYAVHATWDAECDQIRLLASGLESPLGNVQLLNTVADIATARQDGPATPPQKSRNFLAEALQAMDALRVDFTGPDAAAIATSVNGLTAAVLRLAEVTARGGTRA